MYNSRYGTTTVWSSSVASLTLHSLSSPIDGAPMTDQTKPTEGGRDEAAAVWKLDGRGRAKKVGAWWLVGWEEEWEEPLLF